MAARVSAGELFFLNATETRIGARDRPCQRSSPPPPQGLGLGLWLEEAWVWPTSNIGIDQIALPEGGCSAALHIGAPLHPTGRAAAYGPCCNRLVFNISLYELPKRLNANKSVKSRGS